jgi:hypothetical protein
MSNTDITDDFKKDVMNFDYNRMRRANDSIPTSDEQYDISLVHDIIFECFSKRNSEQPQAWDNPKQDCNKIIEKEDGIEIPHYIKHNPLPDPEDNNKLEFINKKYWKMVNNEHYFKYRNEELNTENISITGWNYLTRDNYEIFKCHNMVAELKRQNYLLSIEFEEALKFCEVITLNVSNKKEFNKEDKDTILRNVGVFEKRRKDINMLLLNKGLQNIEINFKVEDLIKNMANEISTFRLKYKIDYNMDKDEILFSSLNDIHMNKKLIDYQIGEQDFRKYKDCKDCDSKFIKLDNVINIKTTDIEKVNVIDKLKSLYELNYKAKYGIEMEYQFIHLVICYCNTKSKLDYAEKYKDSFIHMNAIKTLDDNIYKNINDFVDENYPLDFLKGHNKDEHPIDLNMLKDITFDISNNYNQIITRHKRQSVLSNNFLYSKSYLADIAISSFIEGMNYERQHCTEFSFASDSSKKTYLDNAILRLSQEKDFPIQISSDTSLDINFQSLFFIDNTQPINKLGLRFDNTHSFRLEEEIEQKEISFYIDDILSKCNDNDYKTCYDFFYDTYLNKIDNQDERVLSGGTPLPKSTDDSKGQLFENYLYIHEITTTSVNCINKCLNYQNVMIFYYILFFFVDIISEFKNPFIYKSPFKEDNSDFKGDKILAKNYFKEYLTIDALYEEYNNEESELHYIFIFSVVIYNCIFGFDIDYYNVLINSFIKYFIPFILEKEYDYDSRLGLMNFINEKEEIDTELLKLNAKEKRCLRGIISCDLDLDDTIEDMLSFSLFEDSSTDEILSFFQSEDDDLTHIQNHKISYTDVQKIIKKILEKDVVLTGGLNNRRRISKRKKK